MILVRSTLGNSTPCVKCLEKLKTLGIRRIYFSINGTLELKMEKINEMQCSGHVSSKYRKSFREQLNEPIKPTNKKRKVR